MTRQATLAATLASISIAAVPAACGSSDSGPEAADQESSTGSSSTVDADFVSRADAACAPYADYSSKTFFRISHFNRYAPDAALLPQVAAYLRQNPAYTKLVADLEALGEPKSGAEAWAAVLEDYRTNAADIAEEITVAAKADAARFADRASRVEQDLTALYADLTAAGIGDTSCAKAEVDPLNPPSREGG
jgi:hypothetical protein